MLFSHKNESQQATDLQQQGEQEATDLQQEATDLQQSKAERKAERKARRRGIRRWKGLLADSSSRGRWMTFVAILLINTSLTFMQFGFVGIGFPGDYAGYGLALLGPIAVAALLLGRKMGTLMGLLSALALYLHAKLQPLDLNEYYFVTIYSSVLLYTFAGWFLGRRFSKALYSNPQDWKRRRRIMVSCLLTSILVSILFLINSFIKLVASGIYTYEATRSLPIENVVAFFCLGDYILQILFDSALMVIFTLAVDEAVRLFNTPDDHTSVRTAFRMRLFAVVALVFTCVSATSFALITEGSKVAANNNMEEELSYVGDLLVERTEIANSLAGDEEISALSEEVWLKLIGVFGAESIIEGYDLGEGTLVASVDDLVWYSNSPAYPSGAQLSDLVGTQINEPVEDLEKSGSLQAILYYTIPRERVEALAGLKPDDIDSNKEVANDFSSLEIGYMRFQKVGEFDLMMAIPSSKVYENRSQTMRWMTYLSAIIAVALFFIANRLLRKTVVEPIDRTNASLAKITNGDLNEQVNERGNTEFASLTEGINTTVGALRALAEESEKRIERDLATAKTIQESALPSTFPPFPEVSDFDIFASMDAAKEVGGDFYDFFLIDDHKLVFLIADVSGKGIPGALFMMAAKTEIENYMSTGMEPADAIASANLRLCANNDAGMFVTVWAAVLDYKTGELTYVNAGHNPPLLLRGDGDSWEWLRERCGPFLGTFEIAKYRQEKLTLGLRDKLLLYTDGVNEAFSVDEEEYGNDRLEAFLNSHADLHPEELVHALRGDVYRWAKGAEQSDDVTILSLEYGEAPEVADEIVVPATLDHFEEVMNLVGGELERRLCPVGVMHKIEIALEELFVNVCNYAYAEQGEPGMVTVRYVYRTNPSSITVELSDNGVPFNPLTREDPTKPSSIQEARIGGLGIFMVKKYMDDFAYVYDKDRNVVAVKKSW